MKRSTYATLLAGALFAISSAQATDISSTFTNLDFDASTSASGPAFKGFDGLNGSAYDVPGWQDYGTITDAGTEYEGAWWGPYQEYAAFMAAGNGAYNLSSYVIQAGDEYTISAFAKRWNTTQTPSMTVTLFYGTDPSTNVIGSFTTPTLTSDWTEYTDRIVATPGSVGQTLGVRVVSVDNHVNFDELSIRLDPFAISVSPTEKSTETNQTVEATIVDVNDALVSATLSLDGMAVATNSTPSGTTNTVSYAATELSIGVHTGQVVAVGSTESMTNTWTFQVAAIPPQAAGVLYNINFAGSTGNAREVADGLVLAAGTSGSNVWNNFLAPGVTASTPATPYEMYDADGNTNNAIGLSWYGAEHDFARNTDAAYLSLFQGWYGSVAFTNGGNVELSGLKPNATYDLYVYSTWRWTEDPATFTITEGTGSVTNLTMTPVRANIQYSDEDYSHIVDGSNSNGNYVVFTGLTPSVAGQIDIKMVSANGGFAAIQVVEHSGGPGFAPTINSVAVSGGNVTINWDSDTVGTYRIESKTSLTSPTWNPVAGATGLSGGAGKSTIIPVSGDPAEFFRVYGE